MPSMTAIAHVLRDIRFDLASRDQVRRRSFDECQNDPELSRRWISFVCLAYSPRDDLLYCGLTAYDSDILYGFRPESAQFESLDFPQVADRFDVKVHRSLELDDDGIVYGATACLHGYDQRSQAAGGKIFLYDPHQRRTEVLGIPVPPEYVQTIVLDSRRRIIYGYTYHVPHLFRFDLGTKTSTDLGVVGRDAHTLALDDRGHLWGSWLQTHGRGAGQPPRTSLLEYDPDGDTLTWHSDLHVPRLFPADIGYIDSIVNGADGCLYIGTTAGALVRFAVRERDMQYLGRPLPSERLPGLVVGQDGLLYGCGGSDHDTRLFAFDRDDSRFLDLGPIHDPKQGTSCFITHDLCETSPRRFYVAETDNPGRSGYLWECRVQP